MGGARSGHEIAFELDLYSYLLKLHTCARTCIGYIYKEQCFHETKSRALIESGLYRSLQVGYFSIPCVLFFTCITDVC